jgi:hypothetical protein
MWYLTICSCAGIFEFPGGPHCGVQVFQRSTYLQVIKEVKRRKANTSIARREVKLFRVNQGFQRKIKKNPGMHNKRASFCLITFFNPMGELTRCQRLNEVEEREVVQNGEWSGAQ